MEYIVPGGLLIICISAIYLKNHLNNNANNPQQIQKAANVLDNVGNVALNAASVVMGGRTMDEINESVKKSKEHSE